MVNNLNLIYDWLWYALVLYWNTSVLSNTLTGYNGTMKKIK